MNPLGRAWRVGATGFAFAVFGLVSLLLSLTVLPLVAVSAADVDGARRRVQRVIHYGCRWFIWLMKSLGLITYELHGREHLQVPGRLIVANHPSLIDVVFLLAWMPQLDCIVKQDLWHNPFLRRAVGWAGYIGNASPDGLIESCTASLQAGRSLIVFPEGTRSMPGRRSVFRRGAAHIALRSDADIVPLRIRCEPITLTKGSKWYQVPEQPPHYTFIAAAPMRPERGCREGDSASMAARRLTAQFEVLLNVEARSAAAAVPIYSLQ
ncbi:MAG: lysophospholipid acyltransferase family protein [Nevskiales bacterium]